MLAQAGRAGLHKPAWGAVRLQCGAFRQYGDQKAHFSVWSSPSADHFCQKATLGCSLKRLLSASPGFSPVRRSSTCASVMEGFRAGSLLRAAFKASTRIMLDAHEC